MISHHHYHHHFTFTEMRRLYWARALTALAMGLVAIFIPLYLLSLGYAFNVVVLYFAVHAASNLILGYPVMKLITKIGANHSMAISNVLQIGFFVMLITLPQMHWPIMLLAFLAAVINETHWLAFHVNFSKAKAPGKSGRQISFVTAITSVVAAASPAMGGIIATYLGINYIYVIAICLFIISVVPLLYTKEIVVDKEISFKHLDKSLFRPILMANAGHSTTQAVEQFVWPVFIFLIVQNYATVGILTSLLVFGSVCTAIYVGRREEAKGFKHYLREGSWAMAGTNLLRVLASSAGHIFGINILSGVSNQLAVTPFMTRFYDEANSSNRLSYVLIMEYAWFIGQLLFFGLLYILSLFFETNTVLVSGFVIAIFGSLLMRKMR